MSPDQETLLKFIKQAKSAGLPYKAIISLSESNSIIKNPFNIDDDLKYLLQSNQINQAGYDTHRYVHNEFYEDWLIDTLLLKEEVIEDNTNNRSNMKRKMVEILETKKLSKVGHSEKAMRWKKKTEGKYENSELDQDLHSKICANFIDVNRIQAMCGEPGSERSNSPNKNLIDFNVSQGKYRPRPWLKVLGTIESSLLHKYLHGIYNYIQKRPGVDFKSLFEHFSRMLDKCSFIDLLQYLEVNSAIARYNYDPNERSDDNQLWDEPPEKKNEKIRKKFRRERDYNV